MKIHFREQYGSKGEEMLYVTPSGKIPHFIIKSQTTALIYHFAFRPEIGDQGAFEERPTYDTREVLSD